MSSDEVREASRSRPALVVDRAAPGSERGTRLVQAALPALRGLAPPAPGAEEAAFAHPFERDFARILSFYRIRWAYEPTAFALAWDADGRPVELFTPDFYLPDQRLYVELTAMRQRLVTRKHRKVRRLRELYPGVRIKLLYRRDYRRLALAYARHRQPTPRFAGRILFDEESIRHRIGELANAIAADLLGAQSSMPGAQEWNAAASELGTGLPAPGTGSSLPPVLLAVGRGSTVFHSALAAALAARGVATEADRLTLSRYRIGSGRPRVRVRLRPEADLRGRRVLVVEDVVSTGLSLAYVLGWLRRQGATPEVCALLDRRSARVVDTPIRYAGFEAPQEVLVGFGLSLFRQFRDLPFIAVLSAEI